MAPMRASPVLGSIPRRLTSSRPTGINNLEQRTTQSQTILERAVRCLAAQYGHPM